MEKINFVNNQLPAINATNLNKLQDNVEYAFKSEYTESGEDTYSCNYINGIIESGSNENGNWIKYEDGTMICYMKRQYNNINITTVWGNVYESPALYLGNLPQTFIEIPMVFAHSTVTTVWVESITPTTTSLGSSYFMRPVAGANQTINIMFVAIGKWK